MESGHHVQLARVDEASIVAASKGMPPGRASGVVALPDDVAIGAVAAEAYRTDRGWFVPLGVGGRRGSEVVGVELRAEHDLVVVAPDTEVRQRVLATIGALVRSVDRGAHQLLLRSCEVAASSSAAEAAGPACSPGRALVLVETSSGPGDQRCLDRLLASARAAGSAVVVAGDAGAVRSATGWGVALATTTIILCGPDARGDAEVLGLRVGRGWTPQARGRARILTPDGVHLVQLVGAT